MRMGRFPRMHCMRPGGSASSCPIGGGANDWYVYANEDTNSGLQGSGCPLNYSYTTPSLPNGYYEATYTVRAYKLLVYQTYTYTTPMVAIS